MTVPGVGPVVALAYAATIDIPQRFRSSKAVEPILGRRNRLFKSPSAVEAFNLEQLRKRTFSNGGRKQKHLLEAVW